MRNNIGHLRKLYASLKLRSLSYQVRGNPWLVTSAVGMLPLLAILGQPHHRSVRLH